MNEIPGCCSSAIFFFLLIFNHLRQITNKLPHIKSQLSAFPLFSTKNFHFDGKSNSKGNLYYLLSPKKSIKVDINPVANYLPKFNIRNTRTGCEIRSKSTIKTPDISHLVLMFLLLTLSR